MLEIPESRTISIQAGNTLNNRVITEVIKPTSPHKFAFYAEDPAEYAKLLTGRIVKSTKGHGMFVDINCDDSISMTIGEGTNMRYYSPSEQHPDKHQLLIALDDGSCIVFTVAMYGGIWADRNRFDNPFHKRSLDSISPLDDRFDELFFDNIFRSTAKDISLKTLLGTEQRIPGIGNGVLQDIIFNAGLHPRRKKSALSDFHIAELYYSLKVTLKNMTIKGGRDTEKDRFQDQCRRMNLPYKPEL